MDRRNLPIYTSYMAPERLPKSRRRVFWERFFIVILLGWIPLGALGYGLAGLFSGEIAIIGQLVVQTYDGAVARWAGLSLVLFGLAWLPLALLPFTGGRHERARLISITFLFLAAAFIALGMGLLKLWMG